MDTQRKDRQREGGKETEQRERRRRQEISASNPNNAASASRSAASQPANGRGSDAEALQVRRGTAGLWRAPEGRRPSSSA